jgi:hypothetical protein
MDWKRYTLHNWLEFLRRRITRRLFYEGNRMLYWRLHTPEWDKIDRDFARRQRFIATLFLAGRRVYFNNARTENGEIIHGEAAVTLIGNSMAFPDYLFIVFGAIQPNTCMAPPKNALVIPLFFDNNTYILYR